jgi:hypothetical protein
MNKVVIIYIAYLWVGLIHAIFVGITLYVFLGKWLEKQHQIVPVAIIFMVLVFFELYWIPLFQTLGIEIYVKNAVVHQHFGINEKTDIVNVLRPNWISYLFWIGSTFISYKVGNYIFEKNKQKA